jgi:hypothetical protein
LNFLSFRSLCFISPKYCSQIWYSSIDKLVTQYRKHRACSDRRIVWLKNQYLSLYHENERFQGPTPMNAVLVFGGRQWNSSSLFSYERDHPSSKKPSSVMKSWSNLALRRRNKFEQVQISASRVTQLFIEYFRIVKQVFLLNLIQQLLRNGNNIIQH